MKSTLHNYQEVTGKIDYTFTNDYMFRAILQTNKLVLKGLVSSLLHLPFDEIQNHHNWTDRSLSYLCRNFDQLYHGEEYENIGILDFSLFPEVPEFYASYKMLNIKNHYIFNDKFTLNVLCLKEINLATEEDKLWQIDKWAKLFLAKTWRDIKMIAENDEILTAATKSLFEYNADDLIRQQCRAREEAERHERTLQKKLADNAETIAKQNEIILLQEHTIADLKQDNQKL